MKRFYSLLIIILFSLLSSHCFAQVEVVNAYPNLSFDAPIDYQFASQSDNLVYVAERDGRILSFENDSETSQTSVFLDITNQVSTSGEGGLLGFDFHPDFESNGYFYVYYTAPNPFRSVISRFKSGSDVEDSELIVMEIDQPHTNHNAGQIRFGPDGYLYIALGDGGSGGDPDEHGEDRTTLLGSLLRIDVDNTESGLNYSIPGSNPYVGNTEGYREEIYAYGFRNPYRFSFNGSELWVADVGQSAREEINVVKKGRNYGWNTMEGSLCYDPSSGCDTSGRELPVFEYGRDQGGSITGGFIYRGSKAPELKGRYVYADFVSGNIWSFAWDGNTATDNQLIDTFNSYQLVTFGEDQNGELYLGSFDANIYTFRSPETHEEPDKTSPVVVSTSPNANEQNVEVNTDIRATFSEAMNESTINTSTIIVSGESTVSGSVVYSGNSVTFTPNSELGENSTYTATITTGVKDLASNALENNFEWSFTTRGETTVSGSVNDQSLRAGDQLNQAAEIFEIADITTFFSGGTAPYVYSVTENSDGETVSVALDENNKLTVAATGSGINQEVAEVTISAIDKFNSSASLAFTVTTSPAYGDVNGNGVVNAADASSILQAAIEAITFTATQKSVGDVNEDNNINSFDASITFRYGLEVTGYTKLPFAPSSKDSNAKLVYGKVTIKDGVATIPVMIEGDEIMALDFIGEFNVNEATLQGLTFNGLPAEWMVAQSTDEQGKVKFALAGITPLSNIKIATITFNLNDSNSDVGLRASGAINNVAYVKDELSVKEVPQSFTLEQNYPNPFNTTTQITYQLPEAANVELSVFNMLGQKVRVLESVRKMEGSYTVVFDASDLNSGVYIYQLKAGQAVFNRKMTLIK